MRHSVSRLIRLVAIIGLIGFGAGQYVGQGGAGHAVAATTPPGEPAVVLIWQGKLLPIVTDVFGSLGDLNTALNNHDIDGVAKAGDAFAGEQARFEIITPTPQAVRGTARVMDAGLRNLANGTKALVVGLRANDNTAAQRAVAQIVQGIRQFQQAVDAIRRASGPAGTPAIHPSANGTPAPTPIIKGLP